MSIIKASDFVKRQTANSQFAHFSGSWEQLEKMVEVNCEKGVQGYKPGVLLVPLPAEGFFTSIIELNAETMLGAAFKARRDGEEPFVNIFAVGEKMPAKKVTVVIYSKEVLAENEENSVVGADYEIVSINASPFEDRDTPMDPVTMMRNFLQRPGGTKGEFTAQQFAESILFWSQHAHVMANL